MDAPFTRRRALLTAAAMGSASGSPVSIPPIPLAVIERNDAALERALRSQINNPADPWCGAIPDDFGLHSVGAAGGLVEMAVSAYIHPRSKCYRDNTLVERIRLAAQFLKRSQSVDGNIDLLSTNFNSPPDTGFVVHNVATAAAVARKYAANDLTTLLTPFLQHAAGGLAAGGIHTPNHRWVVCSALAQINDLFPDARYTRRIDQWLAEGIDVDRDGQYIERSTLTYNVVSDRAFVVMAAKLNRPELLDPVRRNLDSMLYLLHADGDIVTEVSRRQDQFTKGNMGGYWFPLSYVALHDGNGRLAGLARQFAPSHSRLSTLLEYPELTRPLPDTVPLPDNFEKQFPELGLVRIRRGPVSATLILGNSSRFFTLRKGEVVIQAVRFASAFFGKGQFIPTVAGKIGDSYVFRQSLEASYYQPLDPPQPVTFRNWSSTHRERKTSETCRLEQTVTITESAQGFRVRVQSAGTRGVPAAIEISFPNGADLDGCRAAHSPDTWLLDRDRASSRAGGDRLRFGPGAAPHTYVQLRGAEPKLPGQSVYVTGYTPFDHTLFFEWV